MPRLANVLNYLTGVKCARVKAAPDPEIWTDEAKMQDALDNLVEWQSGAVVPTAAEVIDNVPAFEEWKTAAENKAMSDNSYRDIKIDKLVDVLINKNIVTKSDLL